MVPKNISNSMYCHNYINGCIKFAINAVTSQQEKILLELYPANTYGTGTPVFTPSGKNASLCCTLCLMHMRHTTQDSSLAMHDLLTSDHFGQYGKDEVGSAASASKFSKAN